MNRKRMLLLVVIVLIMAVGCDGSIGQTTRRLQIELMPTPNFNQAVTTTQGMALLQAEYDRISNKRLADEQVLGEWYSQAQLAATSKEEYDAVKAEYNQRKQEIDDTYWQAWNNANKVVQPLKGIWSKLNVGIQITTKSDVPALPAKLAVDVVFFDGSTATLYGYTKLLCPGSYYEYVEFGTMDYVTSISNLRVV